MTSDEPAGAGFSKPMAATLAATALVVPALSSIRYSPSRSLFTLIWFALLRKPSFNPPNVVFPVAWTAIDTSLAISGYRLARSPSTRGRNRALALFITNVALISSWSRLFFGRHDLAASAAGSALMVATSAAYVASAGKVDKTAAATALPLAVWVGFATVLSTAIWKLNRR